MKSNRFTKFISIVLTLALLLQIAPLQAFATTDETVPPEEVVEAAEITAPAAGVVGEVDDLRSEDGKHFRLSDGSFLSVSYGMPVHYTDENGQWQDIDNTLTFQQGSDGYVTAENGEAVTAFSADLSKGHLATAAWGDTSVSMGLMQPSQLRSILADPEEDAADAVSPNGEPLLQPDYNADAAAEVEAAPATMSLSPEDGWKAEDLMPEKLSSTVLYRDVYPGVDLRYTAFSYNLKEQIIVREKQDSYRYDFLLELKGLTAKMQEDGSVVLSDSEGNAVYGIPAPYMEDAKGASSTAVSYTIQEVENGIVLTVTADPEWINSAAFPVTIDPTLSKGVPQSTMFTQDASMYVTYVASGSPSTIYTQRQYVYMGYSSIEGECWGYVHIDKRPEIPSGAVITSASLHLYASADGDGYSHVGCPQLPMEAYEVTETSSNYFERMVNMNWNNRMSVDTSQALDYTITSAETKAGYIHWDLTGVTKKWYASGNPSQTVALLPADRGSYSSDKCATVKVIAYSANVSPLYIVAYRNNVGIEPYYTYNTMGAGHAGTAYLADATGQLKVVKEVASYASTANPFSVNLVYNSDYFVNRTSTYLPHGSAMNFGSGWTLDCVQTLASQTIGGREYLRYTDGDGTEHYFLKDSSKDSNYYYDEDGLGLKIKAVSGGYEMSTDKDTKYTFTGGFLTSIADANGNKITMTYSGGKITAVDQKNNGGSSIRIASFAYSTSQQNRLESITDAAGNKMVLSYSGDGNLTGITQIDFKQHQETPIARYVYKGREIAEMTDVEANYSLKYYYNAANKVSCYWESADGKTGFAADVSYPDESQTIYRTYGADCLQNTSDDILTSYLFDYAGRTVNAYTTDASGKLLGATNAVYSGSGSTDKTNNRTLRTASMGESGTELLKNGTISGSGNWNMGDGASMTTSVSRDSSGGAIQIKGNWKNKNGNAWQDISLNNPASTTYILSGWAKSDAIPDTATLAASTDYDQFKQFGMRVLIYYSDGGWEYQYVPFCPDLTTWQFTSMAIVPKRGAESGLKVTKIKVLLAYEKNANTAFFDNISLIEQVAQTMKYDEDGRLISVKTSGLEETSAKYEKDQQGNLIKTVTGGYGTYTYGYDTKYNLTSVSNGHVTQSMTYSAQGNVTNTKLTPKNNPSNGPTMTSSARYDANGNRLLSVTDNTGATVKYGYSSGLSKMLALPESVTDALGNTATNTYDHFGRITSTTLANGSGVVYTYTKGQLSELSRRTGSTSQNYSFVYNSFGRMTELKVGNRTLARYKYAIGNGNLTEQTYGNGASVAFTYDQQDRVTTRTTSDGKTRTYRYNEDSRLSSVTDSDGRTIQYLYDGLDRLTKCTVLQDGKEILSTGQSYNLAGQIEDQYWTVDGKTYWREYAYDEAPVKYAEGLLVGMRNEIGDELEFQYDDLERLTRMDSGVTSQAYTYEQNTSGNETTRIKKYVAKFGSNVVWSSEFTYDAAGNITHEKTSNGDWDYKYDTQGQLIKATNGIVTYTFTYDDAGNILTASDGSQTHTYTYGDSSWKDLLTAYDGHAISYDGSGNPTTYYNGRDWTFGWTGSRTLSSASSSSDTGESSIGYAYDLDGIRTGKTVTEKVYHTHAYTETRTVVPTCTAKGYTVETCSCGATRNTNYVAATGHNYTKTKVVEPTCTAQGYTLNTCTKCGATTRTDYVKALGHDYQKAGMITIGLVCTRCGATYGSGGSGGIGGGDIGPTITPTTRPGSMYDGDEGGNETLPPVVDEEVPDETIPPVEEPVPDEEPVPEESHEPVGQSGEKILESENTTAYSYIYASGKLLQEKVTTNGKTETHNFFYDSTGKPYAMQVNGTTYYYVTNLQGDVMGLVDTSGNSVASYTYDPYGKVLTATGALAEKNPLRYRGYYYDSESGLYYLQSRYYDPATRRFINADSYASTGQGLIGHNMFAYCSNLPISTIDLNGHVAVKATMEALWGGYTATVVKSAMDQKTGLVNGQGMQPYSQEAFGESTYENAGCASIATYNALQLIKRPMALGEISDTYFHQTHGFGNGLCGTMPWQIGEFLEKCNIPYSFYLMDGTAMEQAMRGNSVAIITMMNNKDNVLDGFHTVAVRCNGKGYDVYNRNNVTKTVWHCAMFDDVMESGVFICGYIIDAG